MASNSEPPAIEMTASPTFSRSLLSATWIVVDGKPAIEVVCDCATTTAYVIEDDPRHIIEPTEIAGTCDGCGTTRWFTIGPAPEMSGSA